MSSGLYIRGEGVSGSNGSVEILVTAVRQRAETRLGPDDPLTRFLREYEESFPLTGWGIHVDEVLTGPDDRRKFLEVLDAAVDELLAGEAYSEYGKSWLRHAAGWLAERLDPPTASTALPP